MTLVDASLNVENDTIINNEETLNRTEENESYTLQESAVPQQYERMSLNCTPDLSSVLNANFFTCSQGTRNKKNVLRDSIFEDSVSIPGREMDNWTLMYIDDLNIGEVHPLESAKCHFSQQKEVKRIHALHCQKKFKDKKDCTEAIGMKINAKKTQLLCVSDSRHSDIVSYINADDERIESVQEMKILGFIFQNRPNVNAHVKYCITKYNKALWALNHLKRANIDTVTLLETYKVMLRPLLEYCSAVFNPMLTDDLVKQLERQQSTALKIIYGFEHSYNNLLLKTQLPTLAVRRANACKIFARKLADSPRLSLIHI